MNREDFIALLSPEGQQLLARVDYDSKTDVVKLVSHLRAEGFDPALVAAVLTQAKLRRRATAKFGEFAQRMIFTEPGLEQASRLSVAALHAGRFKNAGVSTVADLGCGIGTESLAFASVDLKVSAFDLDEVTAAVATYNLNIFDNAFVDQADVTTLDLNEYDAIFFDPARRDLSAAKGERAIRKFDPSQFAPNFDWVVEQCKQHVAGSGGASGAAWDGSSGAASGASSAKGTPRAAGIKLGPGHPHEAIDDSAEAQWVSVNGDLVELSLWFGAAARPNVKRSALLIDGAGKHHEITSDSTTRLDAAYGELGEYIYEPDNAIIRSHLLGQLANELGLHIFANQIAYLSGGSGDGSAGVGAEGASAIKSPWLKGYRVIDNLTFDRKKLKAYLRERNIGTLEIKKRGSDVVPEQLRKEMALKGEGAATLIVTRVGDAHRVLVTQPLAN